MLTPEKKGAGLRGMVRAAMDRWRRSFNKAGRRGVAAARRPRAWRSSVRPAVAAGASPERGQKVATAVY
jgi:hypothetical protein